MTAPKVKTLCRVTDCPRWPERAEGYTGGLCTQHIRGYEQWAKWVATAGGKPTVAAYLQVAKYVPGKKKEEDRPDG